MKLTKLQMLGIVLLPLFLSCNPTSSNNTVDSGLLAPMPYSPANGSTGLNTSLFVIWTKVNDAAMYDLQVSRTLAFTDLVYNDSMILGDSTIIFNMVSGLSSNTKYYWHARARNSSEVSSWSVSWSFTTASGITDVDGNLYHTIKIGTQTWMLENLKTTKLNDGTSIPLVSGETAWSSITSLGYCWYNNDFANKNMYGALYNWYAVHTGKLAPAGWHVPTDAEWDTLQNYLIAHGYNWDGSTTENKIAKSMCASTIWASYQQIGTAGYNISTNNRSGFTAMPGGFRDYNSIFYFIGHNTLWWSASELNASYGLIRYLSYDYENFHRGDSPKNCGMSIRLVKDN